jgi:hypothetical protein
MKYEFIAPEYLDEEQVKALIKYNFITLKNKQAIWIFNPKLGRKLLKIKKEAKTG